MEINNQQTVSNYDPRWFIWTIVFLVSTGVMLVSYIVISSSNESSNVVADDFKVLSQKAKNK